MFLKRTTDGSVYAYFFAEIDVTHSYLVRNHFNLYFIAFASICLSHFLCCIYLSVLHGCRSHSRADTAKHALLTTDLHGTSHEYSYTCKESFFSTLSLFVSQLAFADR